MPPRRKRRKKRKRKRGDEVMKRRLGLTGWGRVKAFHPWSKTVVSRILGEGHNPGTTAGAVFILPVNNWNDPLGSLSTLVAGTGSLTNNRHPEHHDDALNDGYTRVQVLGWQARINVNWILADNPVQDFMVGYAFVGTSGTEVVLTAGTAARIERMEFLTNPRWTFKHYRAVQGLQEVRSQKEAIVINVPNIARYLRVITRGSRTSALDNNVMQHIIADSPHTSSPANALLFCNVAIITEGGLAMAIDSVRVTVQITQRVKIYRDNPGSKDMDGGEVDVHA